MVTLDALLAFMQKNNYEAELQEDTHQVYTLIKVTQKEFPLFLRIFDEHLLQLIVFIPSHLNPNKQEVTKDMARLLHLLNKEMDLPGFGMDEQASVVFYRLMIPFIDKKIDFDLLLSYVKTAEHICETFAPPIEAISSGQITLDEILEKKGS